MKRVGRAVFSLLIVTGCVAGLEEDPECLYEKQEEGNCETVRVQFDVGCGKTLKSSVSPDEDQVEDLNLYAFCEGKLVAEAYFAGNEQPQLKLLIGHRYNLYVLANMGPVDADVSEEEFRENCCFRHRPARRACILRRNLRKIRWFRRCCVCCCGNGWNQES